jgi:hypothetical protein
MECQVNLIEVRSQRIARLGSQDDKVLIVVLGRSGIAVNTKFQVNQDQLR